MGRDKSRAHMQSAHRIDPNIEQQLDVLRQKLAEVNTTLLLTHLLPGVPH